MAVGDVPTAQGQATLAKEMGEGEKGGESEWKFTMMNPACLGLCLGSGRCDRSSGSQTFGHRAAADGRVAGRSRELTSGFPRRDLQIIGMKAQSWEVCVTASRELVEASHFPLG